MSLLLRCGSTQVFLGVPETGTPRLSRGFNFVTTIVAWAGVDRAVASVYIASDSRISWGDSHGWNQGRKTFAATGSAHIFGYWGDVLFPSVALPTVLDGLAAGAIQPRGSAFGEIGSSIRRLWTDYPQQEQRDFGIVMAARRRDGMQAVFELAIMTYESRTNTWDIKEVPMPSTSARLLIAGSGSAAVRNSERLWEESSQGGTSRATYSAFAEALAQGADPIQGAAHSSWGYAASARASALVPCTAGSAISPARV